MRAPNIMYADISHACFKIASELHTHRSSEYVALILCLMLIAQPCMQLQLCAQIFDIAVRFISMHRWAGGCGYSDLTLLNDSGLPRNDTDAPPPGVSAKGPAIGLFYEGGSGTADYSGQMSFVRLDSAALLRKYWALEN